MLVFHSSCANFSFIACLTNHHYCAKIIITNVLKKKIKGDESMPKAKETKKDTIIKSESDTWVNQRTGEVIETVEIMKPISRQGFMITYLETIIDLMETIGNKKMQIIKHILSNMDKSTNTYLTTTRELAEKTGTATQTVTETLKLLEEKSIIQRRLGAIMINPKLVHRGSNNKEKALITRFYEFNGGEEHETSSTN